MEIKKYREMLGNNINKINPKLGLTSTEKVVLASVPSLMSASKDSWGENGEMVMDRARSRMESDIYKSAKEKIEKHG